MEELKQIEEQLLKIEYYQQLLIKDELNKTHLAEIFKYAFVTKAMAVVIERLRFPITSLN